MRLGHPMRTHGYQQRQYREYWRGGVALLLAGLVLGGSVDALSQTPGAKPAGSASPAKATAPTGSAKPASSSVSVPPAGSKDVPVTGELAPLPRTPEVEYLYKTTNIPSVTRKVNKSVKPPSKVQISSLKELTKEVESYEKDAKRFRDAVTTIVKYHYEERRRRILAGLDRELVTERKELRRARADAIKKLEEFVAQYSGTNSDPEHTPNAMFRLAALYEERARNDVPNDQMVDNLKPAIALYKRVIREFPKYHEKAAIFFYLGHALSDSGRNLEANQVWRSLVCHNRYPYPVETDANDPDVDKIVRKPQDHAPKYWGAWANMHLVPIGLEKKKPKNPFAPKKSRNTPQNAGKSGEEEPLDSAEETSYREIYPDSCEPIPQKTEAGQEIRYVAEIWWRLGDFHFDQFDTEGGPYNYNRSVSAYRQSMKIAKDKIRNIVYGVSMYKLAWAYFKQQRYEAGVRAFVDLLHYTDERQKVTGDPGADFRKEAYDYIAGSLSYVDFKGPSEDEPYIVRDDVLDTENNAAVAEQKMAVGIDRVQDDKLIPQDKPWTIEIYKSLAYEYREINQLENASTTLELMLKKWPLHRDAPVIQDELVKVYDKRASLARDGSEEKRKFQTKALQARTELTKYIGTTEWVNANKDDPEAIQRAEKLVKGGLQQAAAEHTNKGIAFVREGQDTTIPEDRKKYFEQAVEEYKLAEKGWAGYLAQEQNSTDAYESKFWLADAKYWQVTLKVALEKPVTEEEYKAVDEAAIAVRDSNEDDKFLEPSARYVVANAANGVSEQTRLFKKTSGKEGFEERNAVPLTGEGKDIKVGRDELPPQIVRLVAAWGEYYSRVPEDKDPKQNRHNFRFKAAETFYLYGQFGEANKRFEQIYKEECGKTTLGFESWKKLQSMANIVGDITTQYTRSRQLAQREKNPSTMCAVDDAQKAIAKSIADPTIQRGFYKDAYAAFKKAKEMKDGPEREKQWRKAAALYEQALQSAPDREEAPEAAINGAYSYRQVGEYDKAIGMYRLFIEKYGDEKILAKLEKGDKAAKDSYKQRVGYLNTAYQALSESYVLFFNYRAAAETYDKISTIKRFEDEKRKSAAKNALILYANLGDRDKMQESRKRFLTFKPKKEDEAEADFILASADYKQWDENAADKDTNRSNRLKATQSLSAYFQKNQRNNAAQGFNVLAAAYVAKMKAAVNDPRTDEWYKRTIAAFEGYKKNAPTKNGESSAIGGLQADLAAAAEYKMLDDEIRKKFDYETGHHRFKGTVDKVLKQYNDAAKVAEKYHAKLKHLTDPKSYGSLQYITAGLARQGSLYDSLRTGLYNTREPALILFKPAEEKLLSQLEESGNDEAIEKAAEYRDKRVSLWRQQRDKELASADEIAVKRYTTSFSIARKFNVRSPAVNRALQRLAFFTDAIGDDKMAQYTQGVPDFKYEKGMFQKTRPGMVVEPKDKTMPFPLPVIVK
jgi:tetratricopeptide (TPR) repeat protein